MQGVNPATVVGRFIDECWNRGRIELVDELVAADFIDHLPYDPVWTDDIGALKTLINACHRGFSGFRLQIEDMIAEDDRVVVRCIARGRHDHWFLGAGPTQREIAMPSISIYRVEHHQIIDQWSMIDRIRLLQQLGIADPVAVLQR